MKLTEITKDTFHSKLKDPAAQELLDLRDALKSKLPGFEVKVHGGDGEFVTIETLAPWEDDGEYINIVELAKLILNGLDHWKFRTWSGDASDTLYLRVERT